MKRPGPQAGFLLLEVLIAVSVLSIGAASAFRVFGHSLQAQRRLEELSAGKEAVEKILFEVTAGQKTALLDKDGGMESGELHAAGFPQGSLQYEIVSEPVQDSEDDFQVHVKVTAYDEREIYKTQVWVRRES